MDAEYGSNALSIMSYNVQLLFDGESSQNEFDEYDPEQSDWSEKDYFNRLSIIAQSILSYRNKGPDVIVLQEVENAQCLRDLVDYFLFDCNYLDAAFFPSPRDAFGHGLISRYPIIEQSQHFAWNEEMKGRVLGKVEIGIEGETFHLFLNHWKSLWDGEDAARARHLQEGRLLENLVEQTKAENAAAKVIVLGDFNDTVQNLPLNTVEKNDFPRDQPLSALYHDIPNFLTDSSGPMEHDPPLGNPGTYYYQGNWDQLDHLFYSSSVLERFETETKILWNSLVLAQDATPREYIRRYKRGLSDHLPIILELR